jgi:hypothetical protein
MVDPDYRSSPSLAHHRMVVVNITPYDVQFLPSEIAERVHVHFSRSDLPSRECRIYLTMEQNYVYERNKHFATNVIRATSPWPDVSSLESKFNKVIAPTKDVKEIEESEVIPIQVEEEVKINLNLIEL